MIIIKKLSSVLLSVIMLLSVCTALPSSAFAASYKTVSVQENYNYANEVLKKVNKERKAAGASALKMDSSLLQSAMFRAAEITYLFSHDRPDGSLCFDIDSDMYGENIAYGQTDPADVMNSWMNSSGHKANILNTNFSSIGIGCVKYNGSMYWVQCFGLKVGDGKTKTGTANKIVKIALSSSAKTQYDTSKTSIKTIKLSKASYVYDGKTKKPSVTVYDSKGKKVDPKNYTVSYSKGRKNVGKYTVKVTAKGKYKGSLSATFTIKPKSTTLSSVTAGKKSFTAKWKKQATQTTGYQIQYSASSNFKSAKTVTVSKNSTSSKKISKLSAKKKYYVRVRTYKTVKVNGKNAKVYSSWSKAKSVKTK